MKLAGIARIWYPWAVSPVDVGLAGRGDAAARKHAFEISAAPVR